MLTGENFGRSHKRRLTAVFRGDIHRGGGAERLSATDVADNDTAHRRTFFHVRGDLVYRSFLRVRRFKRYVFNERGDITVWAGRRVGRFRLLPRNRNTERKIEKFVEYKTTFRRRERRVIFGTVNVFQRVAESAEIIRYTNAVRQVVGDLAAAERDRLRDVFGDLFLRQSFGETVDRQKIGQGFILKIRFKRRGGHCETFADLFNLSPEAESCAELEFIFEIFLVEESQFGDRTVVVCAEFEKRHASFYPRKFRRSRDGQNNRVLYVGIGCFGEQFNVSAVFKRSRKVVEQVADRFDILFFVGFYLNGSHAF